jgi:hypothetical protein
LEIPEGVTKISDMVFQKCLAIESVVLPTTLNYIGKYAFRASSLKSISLGENINYIGDCAFAQCSSLTDVEINLNTSLPYAIFAECGALENVTISKLNGEVGGSAFYACNKLKTIEFSEGVTKLQKYAFYQCKNLQTVKLCDGLSEIGEGCFSMCSALDSIDMPNSVKTLGNSIFYSCPSLKKVKLSEGLKVIPERIFYDCISLSDVNIPKSTESIEMYAFYKSRIKSLSIPYATKRIGYGAFVACDSLTHIEVGPSVEILEPNALILSNKIQQIISYASQPPVAYYGNFEWGKRDIPVYIPVGSLSLYQQAAEWNKFTNFIEVDFTGVEESSNEAKPNIFISGGALVVSGVSEPIQVTVYNLKGAVVLTQTITAEDSFDMSNIPKGVYVVKANNQTVKVVL